MDGLTAKVFRTYNASITLQQQLNELTSRKCSLTFHMTLHPTSLPLPLTLHTPIKFFFF